MADFIFDPTMPSYSDAYTKVAKKYSLPLWSYKDLIWNVSDNSSFKDYLRFEQNVDLSFHPPWYVHLFMSDIIASIFHVSFHECLMESVHDSLPGMQQDNFLLPHHTRPTIEQYYSKLPPPHAQNSSYCADVSPFLDISAENVLYKRPIKGSFSSDGNWLVYEDRIGKSGFISTFNRSHDEVSTLSFSLENYATLLNGSLPTLVKIFYMRTYKDGGTVDLYLCDNPVGNLDALWKDYKHFRYTFNDMFTFDYRQHHTNYCSSFNPPILKIVHKFNNDGIGERQNQKFKLVSVTICKKDI